jgi:hypothetical protein
MSEKVEGDKETMLDGRTATWEPASIQYFDEKGHSTGRWELRLRVTSARSGWISVSALPANTDVLSTTRQLPSDRAGCNCLF